MATLTTASGLKWRKRGEFVFGTHKVTGHLIAKIHAPPGKSSVVLYLDRRIEIEGESSLRRKAGFESIRKAKRVADAHASDYVAMVVLALVGA